MASDKPLLIGVSARIYYPGTPGIAEAGVWTKTLHYLEQSVAHWIMRGGACAVMIPAVDSTSVVTRDDLNLNHYAAARNIKSSEAMKLILRGWITKSRPCPKKS